MSVVKMFGPALSEGEREAVREMIETLQGFLDNGELQSVAVCALVEGDRVFAGGVGMAHDPYRLLGLLEAQKADVLASWEDE